MRAGGDGLVAARHLWHYGYKPTIYYPKQSKNDLYQVGLTFFISLLFPNSNSSKADSTQRLSTQLKNLNIPFTDDFTTALKETNHIIDAIFGLFVLSPSHFAVFSYLQYNPRLLLLRRSSRAFPGCYPCIRGDSHPCDICRRSLILEH